MGARGGPRAGGCWESRRTQAGPEALVWPRGAVAKGSWAPAPPGPAHPALLQAPASPPGLTSLLHPV